MFACLLVFGTGFSFRTKWNEESRCSSNWEWATCLCFSDARQCKHYWRRRACKMRRNFDAVLVCDERKASFANAVRILSYRISFFRWDRFFPLLILSSFFAMVYDRMAGPVTRDAKWNWNGQMIHRSVISTVSPRDVNHLGKNIDERILNRKPEK